MLFRDSRGTCGYDSTPGMGNHTLRLLAAVTAIGAFCDAACGQYSSTNYSIERWDEDYSYLKDPANRNDLFDPIKYVAIGGDDSYLSFGGQARYRYDYFNNTGFGSGVQDETGFHLVRLLAHVDAHFGPNLRAFVQINSGLEFDRSGGPRPGDTDDFDFQQAFADLSLPLHQIGSVTLRVGRQELIYGAQRLVSPNDWANVRRTFEGAKLSVSLPNDTLDLFWVRPVIIEKTRLNSGDNHTSFAGIYNVTAFPDLLPSANARLDAYLLALNQWRSSTNPVDADTLTLGVRPHANPVPWDFDVEADWQFGSRDSRAICAWSVAAEGGYTFTNLKFTPRASLGMDAASGSPDPIHRFNQLFPPQYLFLGHMYLFGRENILDLNPGLTLNLREDLTLSAAEHVFWRQNTNDAVYDLNDHVVRAVDSSHAASVGNEFDLNLFWQINRHLSAYAGYAHFFAGSFLGHTGPHSDEDFFYASMMFSF